jgi:hypothetical protein
MGDALITAIGALLDVAGRGSLTGTVHHTTNGQTRRIAFTTDEYLGTWDYRVPGYRRSQSHRDGDRT